MSDFGGESLRKQMADQQAARDEAMQSIRDYRHQQEMTEHLRAAQSQRGRIDQRLANERAEMHRRQQLSELEEIKDATLESQAATLEVQAATLQVQQATAQVAAAVVAMDAGTTRLQRWAIGLGLAGTLVGSVVGGFAGAIAARIVGT